MSEQQLDTIEAAIEELQGGRPVIVIDDENRENEGDLIVAAEFASPEMINFMAREARGLICISLPGKTIDRLGLPPMVPPDQNTAPLKCPFTVSVEAKQGVSTGISAFDRARTVATLLDPECTLDDLVMPGHMFPLKAHSRGVLGRRGHTEASVDLVQLAGLKPGAVICEIMDDDGRMARLPRLKAFARKHNLKVICIDDLVAALETHQGETLVERIDSARLPTRFGVFRVSAYRDHQGLEHLFLAMGDVVHHDTPLVRMHSECLTGDVLGSLRCDCGEQLHKAMQAIAAEGVGAVLYLRQEGRGIGLANKIRAYALQDAGMDTVDANVCLGFSPDQRDYSVAANMLLDQGIRQVRLMTNNPQKIEGLEANGIRIKERVPNQVGSRPENKRYLETKIKRMNHLLVNEAG